MGIDIKLSPDDFVIMSQDLEVNKILGKLNVGELRVGLYDLFDTSGLGYVFVADVVSTVMKLRGDSQKTDVVTTWKMLQCLNDKLENVEITLLENQRRLLA